MSVFKVLLILLVPVLTLIGGCTSIDGSQGASTVTTASYVLTPQRADAAIRQAIEEGFNNPHREFLPDGRIEFQFKVTVDGATDFITAEAIREPSGLYHVDVSNRGTAPAAGIPSRNQLLVLINKHARVLSQE